MPALTGGQKLAVVVALACFDTPTEVQRQLKDEFGVSASIQQIRYYDPTTPQGGNELSRDLQKLFRETRAAFLRDTEGVAIANRSVRLRRLERLFHERAAQNDPDLALKILEQAARDSGGAYSNRREITGKDGAPIEISRPLDLSRLSDEELSSLERLVVKVAEPGGDPSGEGAPEPG